MNQSRSGFTRDFSVLRVILVTLGMSLMASAYSHPATERYIPIGYWSDVSGQDTYMGEIKTHDSAAHTMRVEGSSGARTVQLTEQTKIWLDRTAQKRTNQEGSYSDCQPGRTVEVKFKAGSGSEAEWIKVRTNK